MPELTNSLFSKMRRVDGARFHGHLLPSVGVNTKEKAPYRVLHVKTPTFIRAGDTIDTFHGEKLILLEHPDDFAWALSFKGAYAKDYLVWKRRITSLDPVSGVSKGGGLIDMGQIYVNFDTPEDLQMEGVSSTGYRFITGQDIKVNDMVGDYHISKVVKSLGVNIAYVS